MTIFHVTIDRASGAPLHRQIYEQIRWAILDGRLRPGQRIPSTRLLAEELGVSRLPVLSAFDQLYHEGYLVGRVGSGTFVSAALPEDLMRPRALQAKPERRGSDPTPAAGGCSALSPFRTSLPALDQFPSTVWAKLVARHARGLRSAQMAYGDPAGFGPLRAAIAEHLRTARAVCCESEQILIVSGSQAALRLAVEVLVARGDPVAMEEPGYPGARSALMAGGAELVPVPVDDEGLSIADLVQTRVRAVYATPSHQYPLGMAMSAARRIALLDWAARCDAWVIEDDYDSEFRYVSRPLGSLQGLDASERVVYIGTFSKVLFPALRIGYLVVPPSLWSRFIAAREAFDLFPPTLYQHVLADFISEGHFARHLRRMRGVYLARRDALCAGLKRDCAGLLDVANADAGLHLAALLTGKIQDEIVVQYMAGAGLAATALSSCYVGPRRSDGLLLGFGGTTETRLLEATRLLGAVLREATARCRSV